MGTRATYNISADMFDDFKVCFYIHWDSYVKGAANYFWQMHQEKNPRGGYAGQFIRANPLAEFTRHHETYDNTEYRYDLERDNRLTVLNRSLDTNKWKIIYKGTWYDFVNQYLEDMTAENKLYLFKFSQHSQNSCVMSLSEANLYIAEKLNYLTEKKQNGHSGVYDYEEQEINYIQQQIDSITKTTC